MEEEQQELAEDNEDDDGVDESSWRERESETAALCIGSLQTTRPPVLCTDRSLSASKVQ